MCSLGRGEIDLSRRGDRGESKPVPLTKCLGFCRPPGKKSTFETVHGSRSREVAQRVDTREILIVVREKYLGTGLIFYREEVGKCTFFLKNLQQDSRIEKLTIYRDRKFYVFKV